MNKGLEELSRIKNMPCYSAFYEMMVNHVNDPSIACTLIGGLLRMWCKEHNEDFRYMCTHLIVADVLANVMEDLE